MAKKPKEYEEQDKLAQAQRRMKKFCPYCGKRVHFYAFEKKGKQLCDWCGRYVFKDKETEFNYRMKELLNKQKRG